MTVQSMTTTDTRDSIRTLEQIGRLAAAGCEIVRCAVPDAEAARSLEEICRGSSIPVVADIHFDFRLALAAIEAGAAGIRINPGNIGAAWKVAEVVKASRGSGIPIRVGVNAGSLRDEDARRFGGVNARSLAESALREADLIEKNGYDRVKISAKAFDPGVTVEAYRIISERTSAPLHLGITEAGPGLPAIVRSAAGIGALLLEGLGDTIRISLTADPIEEVEVGKELLQAVGLRKFGPVIVSCPTCGRTEIDLVSLVGRIRERLCLHPEASRWAGVTIAVMGCVVNGPGEARQADVGVAAGKDSAVLFRSGRVVRRLSVPEIIPALLEELETLSPQKG